MKDFRWKTMGRLANNIFQFAYLYSQFRDGVIPDWYVQDEKYFVKYKSEILNALQVGIGEKRDIVAIHVRRGDYVGNPFYVDLLQTDYYERAMQEFPNRKFIVVSDDIPFCKQQAIFKDCEFSQRKSEEEDINLIAECRGQIISNSSFGWWGAYISPYSEKVIAPKAWHPDGVKRTSIPANWIQL